MRNFSDEYCRENQNTYFEFNRAVYEIRLKKYCRTEEGTDGNMAHVRLTLDT